jgi:hypothetical protein
MDNRKKITVKIDYKECGDPISVQVNHGKYECFAFGDKKTETGYENTFYYGSPMDMMLESFGINYYEFKHKRLGQIAKMLILFITFLFFGTALKIIADNYWTEVQYQHALFISLPLIGWAWYYFKRLW